MRTITIFLIVCILVSIINAAGVAPKIVDMKHKARNAKQEARAKDELLSGVLVMTDQWSEVSAIAVECDGEQKDAVLCGYSASVFGTQDSTPVTSKKPVKKSNQKNANNKRESTLEEYNQYRGFMRSATEVLATIQGGEDAPFNGIDLVEKTLHTNSNTQTQRQQDMPNGWDRASLVVMAAANLEALPRELTLQLNGDQLAQLNSLPTPKVHYTSVVYGVGEGVEPKYHAEVMWNEVEEVKQIKLKLDEQWLAAQSNPTAEKRSQKLGKLNIRGKRSLRDESSSEVTINVVDDSVEAAPATHASSSEAAPATHASSSEAAPATAASSPEAAPAAESSAVVSSEAAGSSETAPATESSAAASSGEVASAGSESTEHESQKVVTSESAESLAAFAESSAAASSSAESSSAAPAESSETADNDESAEEGDESESEAEKAVASSESAETLSALPESLTKPGLFVVSLELDFDNSTEETAEEDSRETVAMAAVQTSTQAAAKPSTTTPAASKPTTVTPAPTAAPKKVAVADRKRKGKAIISIQRKFTSAALMALEQAHGGVSTKDLEGSDALIAASASGSGSGSGENDRATTEVPITGAGINYDSAQFTTGADKNDKGPLMAIINTIILVVLVFFIFLTVTFDKNTPNEREVYIRKLLFEAQKKKETTSTTPPDQAQDASLDNPAKMAPIHARNYRSVASPALPARAQYATSQAQFAPSRAAARPAPAPAAAAPVAQATPSAPSSATNNAASLPVFF